MKCIKSVRGGHLGYPTKAPKPIAMPLAINSVDLNITKVKFKKKIKFYNKVDRYITRKIFVNMTLQYVHGLRR